MIDLLPIEIAKPLERLQKNKKVAAAYIFGSFINNKAAARDIDICIIGKRLSFSQMARIMSKFDPPADISFLDRMPNYIAFEVFANGKPLFVNDNEFLSQKWLEVVRFYLRHQPMRNRIFKGVKQWLNLKT